MKHFLVKTKKSKFFAKPQTIDNIKFASKKEAARYQELKFLKEKGEVAFFLRQVPFHLPGNIKYISDFMIFWNKGEEIEVTIEDVKGYKTPEYLLKKKLFESHYPVQLLEV